MGNNFLMKLKGQIFNIRNLSKQNIARMFNLMDTFYENMDLNIFIKDLNDKDSCLVLFDENGII